MTTTPAGRIEATVLEALQRMEAAERVRQAKEDAFFNECLAMMETIRLIRGIDSRPPPEWSSEGAQLFEKVFAAGDQAYSQLIEAAQEAELAHDIWKALDVEYRSQLRREAEQVR